jgi:hypothetical protein
MAKAPTLAEELFGRIKSQPDPAAFLMGMADPAAPTFESDFLDFKAKPDSDQKNTELKKIWYEALSGLGNSGGGVLIWGIDARKDQATGIDAACDVKPIPNPNGFKSLLIELQRGATDPPLGNVMVEAWETSPGEGLVVCLIPSGPFKPYRAEISERKQFFMRAADRFFVPSVAVLRSLFYPQSLAVFELLATQRLRIDPYDRFLLSECEIVVRNVGTGTARSPFIVVQFDAAPAQNSGLPNWEMVKWNNEVWYYYGNRPIHPDSGFPLDVLTWSVPLNPSPMSPGANPRIAISFTFHAENQPQQIAEIVFEPEGYAKGFEKSTIVTASEP